MATQCMRMPVTIATVYGLLVAALAAPTNQDVAVRLRHDSAPRLPESRAFPLHEESPSSNLGGVLGADEASLLKPNTDAAGSPASPISAASSNSQIPSLVHSPASYNSIGSPDSSNGLSPAPSPASDPFTNHFVLDTANLDLDSDGCISGEAELDLFKYHVATALIGNPDALLRAHSIVHRTDVNKDGRICWCDFISIYLHDKNTADQSHHAAPFMVILGKESGVFSHLDLDGDGKLRGPELESLVHQFSQCIPGEQARLIVAAISGLGAKDAAVSSDEFARFLGVESNQAAPSTTNQANHPPIAPLPSSSTSGDSATATSVATGSGTGSGNPVKSGVMPSVLLTTTPPELIKEDRGSKGSGPGNGP